MVLQILLIPLDGLSYNASHDNSVIWIANVFQEQNKSIQYDKGICLACRHMSCNACLISMHSISQGICISVNSVQFSCNDSSFFWAAVSVLFIDTERVCPKPGLVCQHLSHAWYDNNYKPRFWTDVIPFIVRASQAKSNALIYKF